MTSYRMPCVVCAAFILAAVPAIACEKHPAGHAELTTATAAPIVIEAPAAVAPAPKVATVPAKSLESGAYENCARMKNQQTTVYLTQ